MILETNRLSDFIKKFDKVIPDKLCNAIINDEHDYFKHSWYSNYTNVIAGDSKDFDRSKIKSKYNLFLNPLLDRCIEKGPFSDYFTLTGKSDILLNRYNINTRMKQHYDHINSLFDGFKKGIPILSIVGVLNDDFEGGDFYFFKDYQVSLNKGDIIVFPSNFLFPHGVKDVTNGTRYSIVQWRW